MTKGQQLRAAIARLQLVNALPRQPNADGGGEYVRLYETELRHLTVVLTGCTRLLDELGQPKESWTLEEPTQRRASA